MLGKNACALVLQTRNLKIVCVYLLQCKPTISPTEGHSIFYKTLENTDSSFTRFSEEKGQSALLFLFLPTSG